MENPQVGQTSLLKSPLHLSEPGKLPWISCVTLLSWFGNFQGANPVIPLTQGPQLPPGDVASFVHREVLIILVTWRVYFCA